MIEIKLLKFLTLYYITASKKNNNPSNPPTVDNPEAPNANKKPAR